MQQDHTSKKMDTKAMMPTQNHKPMGNHQACNQKPGGKPQGKSKGGC